jgi:hypothetical protein
VTTNSHVVYQGESEEGKGKRKEWRRKAGTKEYTKSKHTFFIINIYIYIYIYI